LNFFKRLEGGLLRLIKNTPLRFFLSAFRAHSAKLVVVTAVGIVVAGNVNSNREGGFLMAFEDEQAINEEKIQKRVKSYTAGAEGSIAVPMAEASEAEEESVTISEIILDDEDLAENKEQYQVLTATMPDAKELISQGADVAVYEVKEGDTVGSIAEDLEVTVNTILWANDIADPSKIMPGDKIFVLPITGVQHKVKKNDTIDSIAKKYSAEKEQILSFNDLPADGTIVEGDELIIPGGEIKTRIPTGGGGSAVASGGRGVSLIDRDPRSAGAHIFPGGQCTWYVAQYKYIPWSGHAGTWLYKARAYGVKTGKTPQVGAIMVSSESWYGHVSIVTKVQGNMITVREMNYEGFNVESTRTLSAKSRVIKGFIY